MALSVSVIIPTNRTEYIDECILSVAKQTVRPKEVILLYEYLDEDRDLKGNRGISMSTADAYILLGDDDKLHPEFIEKTVALMEETNADIVYTDMEQIGARPGIHKPFGWRPDVFHENFGIFFTCLVRKSLWQRVGGFDPLAGPFHDWDFWWMCAEKGAKAVYLPEPLFIYRTHPEQDSQKLTDDMCKWSRDYILDKHAKLKIKPQRHK